MCVPGACGILAAAKGRKLPKYSKSVIPMSATAAWQTGVRTQGNTVRERQHSKTYTKLLSVFLPSTYSNNTHVLARLSTNHIHVCEVWARGVQGCNQYCPRQGKEKSKSYMFWFDHHGFTGDKSLPTCKLRDIQVTCICSIYKYNSPYQVYWLTASKSWGLITKWATRPIPSI